jgi:hypothetical protein
MGAGKRDDAQEGQRDSISRRTLIRRAAATGAVAWTAPTIIQSLTSPAAAVTGAFPCSYASIVYTVGATGPFVVKIDKDTTTCILTNATSGDNTFTQVCGADTYTNTLSGNAMCKNGAAVPAGATCPFTVSGGNVTANAGVTIQFVAIHDGSIPGNKFEEICGPITSFNAPASCGSTA